MTDARRSEFLAGVRDELPILVGVAPFGMIYGVLALGAGLPAAMAQAMSTVVFAGSAQFITVQLVNNGAPALVILLTVFVVNLRHALYSASVAPFVRHLPPLWKGVLAYLLTDEAYAVTITHYAAARPNPAHPSAAGEPPGNAPKHWYFLGAGLALWSAWQLSTAVGIFLGAQVPPGWGLDFTLSLTFIAIIVPVIQDKPALAAALSAGLAAALGNNLPYKLGLVLAALVGIGAGMWSEKRWPRSG